MSSMGKGDGKDGRSPLICSDRHTGRRWSDIPGEGRRSRHSRTRRIRGSRVQRRQSPPSLRPRDVSKGGRAEARHHDALQRDISPVRHAAEAALRIFERGAGGASLFVNPDRCVVLLCCTGTREILAVVECWLERAARRSFRRLAVLVEATNHKALGLKGHV